MKKKPTPQQCCISVFVVFKQFEGSSLFPLSLLKFLSICYSTDGSCLVDKRSKRQSVSDLEGFGEGLCCV